MTITDYKIIAHQPKIYIFYNCCKVLRCRIILPKTTLSYIDVSHLIQGTYSIYIMHIEWLSFTLYLCNEGRLELEDWKVGLSLVCAAPWSHPLLIMFCADNFPKSLNMNSDYPLQCIYPVIYFCAFFVVFKSIYSSSYYNG